MLRPYVMFFLLLISLVATAQQKLDKLTVQKIMRDPKWIGTSPSNLQWSHDGQYLFFNWNPGQQPADSLYYISLNNKTPVKATLQQTLDVSSTGNLIFNENNTRYLYTKDGDIFYTDNKTGITRRIAQTTDVESNPRFSFNETRVVYTRNQNLYARDIGCKT